MVKMEKLAWRKNVLRGAEIYAAADAVAIWPIVLAKRTTTFDISLQRPASGKARETLAQPRPPTRSGDSSSAASHLGSPFGLKPNWHSVARVSLRKIATQATGVRRSRFAVAEPQPELHLNKASGYASAIAPRRLRAQNEQTGETKPVRKQEKRSRTTWRR